MLLYPLIYFLPAFVYPWASEIPPKTRAQSLACAYWVFHYAKREYETFFVHKFSHATMPLRNLFKNCMYYWSFAAYVSYFVNHPLYMPPSEMQTLLALAFALLCQLSNYRCHVILANLRPGGTGAYVVPRGFLFDYITCPNYTSEILGWVSFAVATQAAPAAAFALVGAAQMAAWAAGKHARLRKTFDGRDGREKYPKRWIMLPPFF
jgi:very-long-chain enoyl-CoA reductase